MKLSDVAAALDLPLPTADCLCRGVAIDSRTAPEQSLFIAIKGENHDGHQYIQEMESRCAAAVVSEKNTTGLPCFQVEDTMQALTQLAAYWRDQVTSSVVAITGSCGKTTTRALLHAVLSQAYSVMASEKSHNNAIGVPLTLLQAKPNHEHLILEVGTSWPGEIAGHSKLVRPSIAVILNASTAHLAGLGSLAGVVQEKGDLLVGLQENGVAILNRDDPNYSVWEKRVLPSQRVVSFGCHPEATVRAEAIKTEENGEMSFSWSREGQSYRVNLPLLGRHNVENALAAIAVALELGVTPEQIQLGMRAGEFEPRRLQVKNLAIGARVIDDSYNANPKSMQAAIDVLAQAHGAKKILVIGDMLELGDQAGTFHRQVGEQAKKLGIDALHGYGSCSREAVDSFGDHARHWQSLSDLSEHLRAEMTADMVILIKGSNSMKMNQVVQALLQPSEEK